MRKCITSFYVAAPEEIKKDYRCRNKHPKIGLKNQNAKLYLRIQFSRELHIYDEIVKSIFSEIFAKMFRLSFFKWHKNKALYLKWATQDENSVIKNFSFALNYFCCLFWPLCSTCCHTATTLYSSFLSWDFPTRTVKVAAPYYDVQCKCFTSSSTVYCSW